MIEGLPETKDEIKEARLLFQIGENTEGLSKNYYSITSSMTMHCESILGIQKMRSFSEEKSREIILKIIKNIFISYTDYMNKQEPINGLSLESFLTEKGKEKVKRLDQIATEIKSISTTEDPKDIDIKHLYKLTEESRKLIKGEL